MNNKLYEVSKMFDYTLFIDLDEYLVMQTFQNIKDMIHNYLPFDIIKLNWVLFGNGNNKDDPPNNSLIENFKYSRNIPFSFFYNSSLPFWC